jgi:hypothetical protein
VNPQAAKMPSPIMTRRWRAGRRPLLRGFDEAEAEEVEAAEAAGVDAAAVAGVCDAASALCVAVLLIHRCVAVHARRTLPTRADEARALMAVRSEGEGAGKCVTAIDCTCKLRHECEHE